MAEVYVLCGPSCVGKSPLWNATKRIYPEVSCEKIVLYTSRAPRAGEVDGIDYHFRSRSFVEKLKNDRDFIVMDVRGDMQAVNPGELKQKRGKVLYEGNPFIGEKLLEIKEIETTGIFLSPLSGEEIKQFKGMEEKVSLEGLIEELMRKKLLRRAKSLKGILSLKDLEEVERRCKSAYREMKLGYKFDYVIPNHDGEDSDNWSALYYPVGDARRTLLSFVDILEGREPRFFERWERDLLG
ncbi:MAG: hypothetical protein SVE93_06275 [Candidatus Thermoplasmatota archaeon]|nr:hypothetical protein [Candidatus Thermoplasmatota archaeon]